MKYAYVLVFIIFCNNYYAQNSCPGTPTVEYSGKTYHTVQVGTQCWLKENLDIGVRVNGSLGQADNGIIEKFCNNDNDTNCADYGGVYQWAEAVQYQNGAANGTSPSPAFTGNVQGICPTGWHIPTVAEFTILKTAVGDDGNKLKREDQGIGGGIGTNTSGFSALLTGFCSFYGTYLSIGSSTSFWSINEYDRSEAYSINLINTDKFINNYRAYKIYGFSVRCLKDVFSEVGENLSKPNSFSLAQNYPNPFNPTTTINYSIPESNIVTIKVYDVLGTEITTLVNGFKNPGSYEISFDASKLSSGTYFYELKSGSFAETKKLLLIK